MDRKGMTKAVWAISRELGISKDDVYALLFRETGNEHMSDCTDAELSKLLKALDALKNKKVVRAGRITDKQLQYIKGLEKQLGWMEEPGHLRNFIKKYTKVDFLEWLTPKQASNIIIALDKILRAENEQEACEC